jgi:DNA (cytosine-5)-methyltransferase 1
MKKNSKTLEQTIAGFALLEEGYQKAVEMAGQEEIEVSDDIRKSVDVFIENIDSDKSLVSVIVTSLLKKLITPDQDIRYHMAQMDNGYSARGLDTKVTSPFFNRHFTKYGSKETAFLTKATRSEIVWNLTEGKKLPLRSKRLIKPFLETIDRIQSNMIDLKDCLAYILFRMSLISQSNQSVYEDTIDSADFSDVLNINTVLEMLRTHFESHKSSRLPVIAIYSAYIQLFKNIKRYQDKVLLPLNVHTSADKHGYGDIEIWMEDKTPFEMVEIKHNIPIDRDLILNVIKKTEETPVERYYILTTYKNSFKSEAEESYINNLILKTKKERNIEIIANGIIYTLKYYLRFVDDYHEFVNTYTNELINESKRSTEVTENHLQDWRKILENHHLHLETLG